MQLLASAPAPSPTPQSAPDAAPVVDTMLVPGLRLPKIPGLPGVGTPGVSLGDIAAPPAPGSVVDRLDRAAVKGAQLLRTPEGDAWAVRMAKEGTFSLWIDLAQRRGATTGAPAEWLETALVAASLAASSAASSIAKRRYQRDRPFVTDPSIVPAVPKPHNTSYPSGHASAAYAAARVIATMEPSLAKDAYSLAQQVAVSRVYGGVHYPTDVVAGALLGTAVGETVLRAVGRGADIHDIAVA